MMTATGHGYGAEVESGDPMAAGDEDEPVMACHKQQLDQAV